MQDGEPKQSWANSRDLSAEKLAQAIVDQMLAFHEVGDPDVNRLGYYQLINAWVNSRDQSQQEGKPK